LIENCTLYFPAREVALKSVFPQGKSDSGLFRKATWFEYEAGEGKVRLNLAMKDLPRHLQGFRAYVAQLPGTGPSKAEAVRRIAQTQSAVGVILPGPVSPDSRVFTSLVDLIGRFDGFMFVGNSIMLADGTFLVGPLAEPENHPHQPSIETVNPDEYRHAGGTEGVEPARVAMRERHYVTLAEHGFRCARWLPLHRNAIREDRLRPLEEMAGRLFALNALFLWVVAGEENASSARLFAFVDRNGLRSHLTEEENAILALARDAARREHADTIGWRLENMWPLAWILGFDPAPPFFEGQIPQEVVERMIDEFLPNFDGVLADFGSAKCRAASEVGELEDLYYCAHNAVRSAQLGEETVPEWFHPVEHGGAIHERRQSLTWALSPGVAWDETDVST